MKQLRIEVSPMRNELRVAQTSQTESLLAMLCKRFPQTFRNRSQDLRPLKINIHRDLYLALQREYSHKVINRTLKAYTKNPVYARILVKGSARVDLEGKPAGTVTDEHVQIAQKMKMRNKQPDNKFKQLQRNGLPLTTNGTQTLHAVHRSILGLKQRHEPNGNGLSSNTFKVVWQGRPTRASFKPQSEINGGTQKESAVSGRMAINLRISQLPQEASVVKNNWQEFTVKADKYTVKVTVRPKIWKKLQQIATTRSFWTAFISGRMGAWIKGGFELDNPIVQIFEWNDKTDSTEVT